jgi:hypothetical protein
MDLISSEEKSPRGLDIFKKYFGGLATNLARNMHFV